MNHWIIICIWLMVAGGTVAREDVNSTEDGSVEYSYEYYLDDDVPESFKTYLESSLTPGSSNDNTTQIGGLVVEKHHSHLMNQQKDSNVNAHQSLHKNRHKIKHLGNKNHKVGHHKHGKHSRKDQDETPVVTTSKLPVTVEDHTLNLNLLDFGSNYKTEHHKNGKHSRKDQDETPRVTTSTLPVNLEDHTLNFNLLDFGSNYKTEHHNNGKHSRKDQDEIPRVTTSTLPVSLEDHTLNFNLLDFEFKAVTDPVSPTKETSQTNSVILLKKLPIHETVSNFNKINPSSEYDVEEKYNSPFISYATVTTKNSLVDERSLMEFTHPEKQIAHDISKSSNKNSDLSRESGLLNLQDKLYHETATPAFTHVKLPGVELPIDVLNSLSSPKNITQGEESTLFFDKAEHNLQDTTPNINEDDLNGKDSRNSDDNSDLNYHPNIVSEDYRNVKHLNHENASPVLHSTMNVTDGDEVKDDKGPTLESLNFEPNKLFRNTNTKTDPSSVSPINITDGSIGVPYYIENPQRKQSTKRPDLLTTKVVHTLLDKNVKLSNFNTLTSKEIKLSKPISDMLYTNSLQGESLNSEVETSTTISLPTYTESNLPNLLKIPFQYSNMDFYKNPNSFHNETNDKTRYDATPIKDYNGINEQSIHESATKEFSKVNNPSKPSNINDNFKLLTINKTKNSTFSNSSDLLNVTININNTNVPLFLTNFSQNSDKLKYLSEAIDGYNQNSHVVFQNEKNDSHIQPLEDMISHMLNILSTKTLKKRKIKRRKYRMRPRKELNSQDKDLELSENRSNTESFIQNISKNNVTYSDHDKLTSPIINSPKKRRKVKRRKVRKNKSPKIKQTNISKTILRNYSEDKKDLNRSSKESTLNDSLKSAVKYDIEFHPANDSLIAEKKVNNPNYLYNKTESNNDGNPLTTQNKIKTMAKNELENSKDLTSISLSLPEMVKTEPPFKNDFSFLQNNKGNNPEIPEKHETDKLKSTYENPTFLQLENKQSLGQTPITFESERLIKNTTNQNIDEGKHFEAVDDPNNKIKSIFNNQINKTFKFSELESKQHLMTKSIRDEVNSVNVANDSKTKSSFENNKAISDSELSPRSKSVNRTEPLLSITNIINGINHLLAVLMHRFTVTPNTVYTHPLNDHFNLDSLVLPPIIHGNVQGNSAIKTNNYFEGKDNNKLSLERGNLNGPTTNQANFHENIGLLQNDPKPPRSSSSLEFYPFDSTLDHYNKGFHSVARSAYDLPKDQINNFFSVKSGIPIQSSAHNFEQMTYDDRSHSTAHSPVSLNNEHDQWNTYFPEPDSRFAIDYRPFEGTTFDRTNPKIGDDKSPYSKSGYLYYNTGNPMMSYNSLNIGENTVTPYESINVTPYNYLTEELLPEKLKTGEVNPFDEWQFRPYYNIYSEQSKQPPTPTTSPLKSRRNPFDQSTYQYTDFLDGRPQTSLDLDRHRVAHVFQPVFLSRYWPLFPSTPDFPYSNILNENNENKLGKLLVDGKVNPTFLNDNSFDISTYLNSLSRNNNGVKGHDTDYTNGGYPKYLMNGDINYGSTQKNAEQNKLLYSKKSVNKKTDASIDHEFIPEFTRNIQKVNVTKSSSSNYNDHGITRDESITQFDKSQSLMKDHYYNGYKRRENYLPFERLINYNLFKPNELKGYNNGMSGSVTNNVVTGDRTVGKFYEPRPSLGHQANINSKLGLKKVEDISDKTKHYHREDNINQKIPQYDNAYFVKQEHVPFHKTLYNVFRKPTDVSEYSFDRGLPNGHKLDNFKEDTHTYVYQPNYNRNGKVSNYDIGYTSREEHVPLEIKIANIFSKPRDELYSDKVENSNNKRSMEVRQYGSKSAEDLNILRELPQYEGTSQYYNGDGIQDKKTRESLEVKQNDEEYHSHGGARRWPEAGDKESVFREFRTPSKSKFIKVIMENGVLPDYYNQYMKNKDRLVVVEKEMRDLFNAFECPKSTRKDIVHKDGVVLINCV